MTIERTSPCKVNLLLNILEKRADGFHELETVMQPVPLCDRLEFARAGSGVDLTCNLPDLPVDGRNLVVRASALFLQAAGISEGVRIRLEKRIPLAAGLGGGSGNAATTLRGLNDLFGRPLGEEELGRLAVQLGSDVPFFLQSGPALATGRGEKIEPLDGFPALKDAWVLLIHPGFGISTAWAYQSLAQFPAALRGEPGRAARLVGRLQQTDLREAAGGLYNALEAPALAKYPILALYQEFLRAAGADGTLMSGSGSTTFALVSGEPAAARLRERFQAEFGTSSWTEILPLRPPTDSPPPR